MKQTPMESRQASADPVSSEMTAALELMIRRVRRLIVLRGLSLMILTWLAGLAVAMTIDGYWVIYSTWARWGLSLITYGPAAAIAVWSLLRPLSQTLTPAGLARVIERRHPELHERISSAVELLAAVDTPQRHGSAALIRALGEAASADIRHVDPRVEISIHKVARYLAACATALLVIVAITLAWPSTAGRLALRSALPILNLPNIHAGHLTVEPGDTVMLRGDRLRVALTSTRAKLPDARLILEHADDRRETVVMNRIPGGDSGKTRFSIVTEPLNTDVRYRIRGGDAVTRAYQVTVTSRPDVEYLDISYHYPAYTERESSRTRVVHGDIRAVTGTEVEVRATFNKPVTGVTLFIDGYAVAQKAIAEPARTPARTTPRKPANVHEASEKSTTATTGAPDEPDRGDARPRIDPEKLRLRQPDAEVAVFRLQLKPGMQTVWKIEGTDEYGFTGGTRDSMLYAVADAVPEVKLTHPTEDQLRLRATDRVNLGYTIIDDFGIGLAGLILEADGRPLPIRRLPLAGTTAANRNLQGELTLDLGELPLHQTQRLTLQLRARDLRSEPFGGPQVGKSRILRIDLDDTARPYREQVLEQHTQRLRQALTEARDAIAKTRQPLTQLEQALQQPQTDERTIHASTRRALSAIEDVDHALETTAEIMRDGFYDGLRQPLTEDAGAEVIHAAETVSQIPVADDRETQTAMTAETDAALDRADTALESMTEQLDAMHQALEHALATRDLAERQTDMAAAMAPINRWLDDPVAPPDTRLTDALMQELEAPPPGPKDFTELSAAEDSLERWRKQQEILVDELAAMIESIPDARRIATEHMREDVARLSDEIARLHAQHEAMRVQTAESKQKAAGWETAAEALASQFAALSEAHRDLLLPQPTVAPADIASDLEAGRLQQAAEKIDSLADDLAQRREMLEREQRTEELAEQVRELTQEQAARLRRFSDTPVTATRAEEDGPADDHAALAALADRYDGLAEDAQQATPLAQQAFSLYNPADDLRAALPSEDEAPDAATGQPEAAETARDKATRLRAALEAAAQSAKAERLAERFDAVTEELDAMENLLARSHDLAKRMEQALDPWQQTLDTAEAQAAKQADAVQRRQQALADDAQALLDQMRDHPVAGPAVTDALQQALMPPPDRLPSDASPPSTALDAQQAAHAAEETRRAADAAETQAAQTRERADAMVRRARDALDDMAGVADNVLQREARWRLEEAEEARERELRRVEDAQDMAGRLKHLAHDLDEIADDVSAAEAQHAAIATDRERAAEAQTLAEAASRRAETAERAIDRLREKQARLQEQQEAMPADIDALPAPDTHRMARWQKEKSVPAAAEALQALSQTAADLAQRQAELADTMAETQADQEALHRRPTEMREPPTAAEPVAAVADAAAPDADTERETLEKVQALETGMRELAETQRALARDTREIKQQAAELTADTRPIPLPQPEQFMDRAARALESGDPKTAREAARQAGEEQAQLAETLADRATTMPPDKRMAAAQPSVPADPDPVSDTAAAADETTAVPGIDEPARLADTTTAAPAPDDLPGISSPPVPQVAFDQDDIGSGHVEQARIPEDGTVPSSDATTRKMPRPPPLPRETGSSPHLPALTENDLEAARREFAELSAMPADDPDRGFAAAESVADGQTAQPSDPSVATEETSQQTMAPQTAATPPSGVESSTAMPADREQDSQPGEPAQPMAGAPAPSTPHGLAPEPGTHRTVMDEPGMPSGSPLDDLQPGVEAERIRRIEERLDPQQRVAESLPAHSGWREIPESQTVPPETISRLFDQIQQLDALAPRFLAQVQMPDGLRRQPAGDDEAPEVETILPRMASHAQAYHDVLTGLDPDTLTPEAAAEHRALAEALQYAGRASLDGDPRDAEEAARRMALTAEAARRRVEAMGLSVEPRLAERVDDDNLSQEAMRRLGLPVSDWLRLPGELRSEVLQARPAEGPEEYRTLIKRYFSDIARERETE